MALVVARRMIAEEDEYMMMRGGEIRSSRVQRWLVDLI